MDFSQYPGGGKPIYDTKLHRIQWPVIFLYPEYYETDFIQTFDESHCVQDHLNVMFGPNEPAPAWDKHKKYKANKLRLFYEVSFRSILHSCCFLLFVLLCFIVFLEFNTCKNKEIVEISIYIVS